MRRLALSALLGLSTLGLTFGIPAQAHASWLSEALDRTPIQVTVAPTPSYYPPAYVPTVPAYYPPAPAYVAPVPSYSGYAPVPVTPTVPVTTVPVYRPAPICPPAPPVVRPYDHRPDYRADYRYDARYREWHRERYGW